MAILGEEHYDAIRKAISLELTDKEIPDTVIALPIYQGTAERWAALIDSQIVTRTDAQKEAAENAVILKTASLLVAALPILEREEFGPGEGFTRQRVDRQKLSEQLAARAQAELDSYLISADSTTTATFLPVFAVGGGRRGQ